MTLTYAALHSLVLVRLADTAYAIITFGELFFVRSIEDAHWIILYALDFFHLVLASASTVFVVIVATAVALTFCALP